MTLPAIPAAQSLTPAQVAEYGAQIVAWAEQINDIGEVREAASKWAAITEYVRRTSREGVAEAEATLRRLEVRVGMLLGPPTPGARTDLSDATDGLSADARYDLRILAEHADIVEQVIAESTDAEPPSRRKVLTRIRDTKNAVEMNAARDEDRQWAADLRERAGSDPAEDRRRQLIRMAVRTVMDAVERLDQWPRDEIHWAIDTSYAHVRDQLTTGLRNAATTLKELDK